MRVLYVLPGTAVGGAEVRFSTIAKSMVGVQSVVLTQNPVADYFSSFGLEVYRFEDYGCSNPMNLSVRNIFRYAASVADVASREQPDCMVGVMHTGSLFSALAKDFYRLKVPLAGTIEGNMSAFFRSRGKGPSVIEKALLGYLLRRPSMIVVPSRGVKDDIVEIFGIDGGRIRVIYNAVDVPRISALAAEDTDLSAAYDGKTILTACRLNAQKDLHTLLNAFRSVRERIEARLVIVGDGELRDVVIESARNLGIEEHIILTGFRVNPYPFFRKADVFVLSSFFEGLPTVIIEAMALGVPVVSSDCPSGPNEIIQHGRNGFLVPVGDSVAMADAIMKLLADKDLARDFAAQGKKRAEFFSAGIMVEGFRESLTQVSGRSDG